MNIFVLVVSFATFCLASDLEEHWGFTCITSGYENMIPDDLLENAPCCDKKMMKLGDKGILGMTYACVQDFVDNGDIAECPAGKALNEDECANAVNLLGFNENDGVDYAEKFGSSYGGSGNFGNWFSKESCGCYVDDNGKRYFNKNTKNCKTEANEKVICYSDCAEVLSDGSGMNCIRQKPDGWGCEVFCDGKCGEAFGRQKCGVEGMGSDGSCACYDGSKFEPSTSAASLRSLKSVNSALKEALKAAVN